MGRLSIIKDMDENLLHRDENIKRRWREYFEQLLNTENEREELGEVQKVEGPVMEVQDAEVNQTLSKMKNGKSPVLN